MSSSEPPLEAETQVELGEANFFSKLSFSWINPLLSRGYLRPLTLEDIPSISTEDESNLAYRKFANAWESLIRGRSSSDRRNLVLTAITKVYFKENILIAVCAVLRTISVVALPLLLYAFVNYSKREKENLLDGLVLLGCLIVSKFVESLSQRYWFFASRRSGMRMRSALMVAVYQKQLKLSSLGRQRHSTGEIVNYISVDAYRMGEFPWWFHLTWSLVLQLFMSIGVLFWVVGLGAILGIVPLAVCGFLNMPFAKIIKKYQSQFMISQDERLRAISEILNSMKIIKLQSWEEKFKGLIESLRSNEFKWLAKQQFLRPYAFILYWISQTIVSSSVFLGCALFGSAPLNAGTIFTVLATLRVMAEPVRMLPDALSILIQVKVSFGRINTFLIDDELTNDEVRRFPLQNSDKSVTVEAGNFSWVPETASLTLRNVELEIKRGQKIAACGPVGAGKSSILYAMLGEIPKLSGTVHVIGSIAYVSQVSWIQSGTIRENILYGKPMDAVKYDQVIKACALDKDINSFDHGDLTEIGQRGINMSGGQKQRIQLARAVYNDADIYLLDDPFSAVDAHTASVLFNDCVMKALEKKTVILVTHQVEFLSKVDKILVMDGGQITQSGSYEEVLMAGTPFEQLVNAHRNSKTAPGSWNGEGRGESQEIAPEMSNAAKQNSEEEILVKGPPGIQLTQDEETEIGDVGWKPFMDYVSISKGSVYLFLSILIQCIFVVLQAASTFWLAFSIQIPNMTNSMLIGVYSGLATLSTVFVFVRSHYAAHLGLKASKAFFSGFTNAIFKAPMLFFDSTPVGRILTRASSDMSILDFEIPIASVFVVCSATELMAIIGIMAFITWQALIVAILAMVPLKYIQGYYMSSARELIRINGTTKAPIMNHATETSQGVVTIRAFNVVDRFFKNYLKLVDTDATLFFLSNAAMEWLVLRIETIQNLTLFTAAFFLLLLPKHRVTPGLVGLSLSYALSLTTMQILVSRWYCNLSNYLISVERIKQFMHIPEELPAIIEDNRPPSSWPSKGRIEFQELKIRYRSNAPLVLKGITCTFPEGTRVGVVGRSGSGKTTLISALFRIVEPASGKILIDGLDICSVGLKDLRMKLSIIPQEPTLFRGSIRTNLDPLGLYSDDEIWKVLEKCQLKAIISGLPKMLDSSVSDEGENWSVGQRQLFCLGRVLLKRNRILVLDEATASIDSATDAILQRIIREEFSNCTVVTVAHRVPTVIDSDMVMVLSYGELQEYDEPSNLLATNSSFSMLNFSSYK
ncbi:multidrug resistance-associated protein 6 [Hibiscus trionum]|uniref:ABC-type xenobiotic transporter n=1 Tax=Hibiscus trionum TaxID=183268 RepID=A0A9W7LVC6_HIBTR|nr:multidrug resistance-associated protein 6 [Hibiscus trionum]